MGAPKHCLDRLDFDITKIKNYQKDREIYGHIYLTIFPNKKVYVGQFEKRINSSSEKSYFGSGGWDFKTAQAEFGKENLTKIILYLCYDLEEYNREEERLIAVFKACDPERGYNVLKTSANVNKWYEGINPAKLPEVRIKISITRKSNDKKVSEETLEKMSESQKNNWQRPGYKEMMSEKRKQKHKENPRTKESLMKLGQSLKNSEKAKAQRKRLHESKKDKPISNEQKEKISIGHKNSEKSKTHLKEMNENKRGSKCYHKGGEIKFIHPGEEIPDGFLIGRGSPSKETREKSSKSLKGKVAWNKGLSKETDERMAKLAQNQIGRKMSDEFCKNASEVKKGTQCFHNGKRRLYLHVGEKIPKGFIKGGGKNKLK